MSTPIRLGTRRSALAQAQSGHVAAALEKVKALGYLQAPVVITDEDHWAGFRPDKIDELAARLT